MGNQMFDQFSYLHFASGIIAYFWGIPFIYWVVLHVIFEIFENTNIGIWIINNLIVFWPGGKSGKDSLNNIIGDNITAFLGWFSAYYLDKLGSKYNWYSKHII